MSDVVTPYFDNLIARLSEIRDRQLQEERSGGR